MSTRRSTLAVGILVCLLALVAYMVLASGRGPSSSHVTNQYSTRSATQVRTYSAYVGHWCDSENASRPTQSESGISEIAIDAADTDSVTFNVLHTAAAPAYRMTGSETTITAPIKNGVAAFTFRDERGGMNAGTIQFLEDKLVVEIRTTSANGNANGSVAMNCLMLRDQYFGTREVLSPAPATAAVPAYHTPAPGSTERSALMDAARRTFDGDEQIKFIVHELYVQEDWAVGTLDPAGYDGDPPYVNVYVWRRTDGRWTCLQGCGDVGDLTLDDIRTSISRYGVPASLVAAVQFK